MTRGTGFASADLDVGFFRDVRIKRLAREHADVFPIAALGYIGIVLHCWSVGDRLPATDAWPDLVPWSDAAVDALKAVELLDRAGRVRLGAWQGWFGVAYARREERRAAGALGGKTKAMRALAQLASSASTATLDGLAQLQQNSSIATPKSYPSVPILPTDSPQPPASGGLKKRPRREKGDTPRANGKSPRQLREGTKAIDAGTVADLTARTAAWNAAHPGDPIEAPEVAPDEWIAGGGDG